MTRSDEAWAGKAPRRSTRAVTRKRWLERPGKSADPSWGRTAQGAEAFRLLPRNVRAWRTRVIVLFLVLRGERPAFHSSGDKDLSPCPISEQPRSLAAENRVLKKSYQAGKSFWLGVGYVSGT